MSYESCAACGVETTNGPCVELCMSCWKGTKPDDPPAPGLRTASAPPGGVMCWCNVDHDGHCVAKRMRSGTAQACTRSHVDDDLREEWERQYEHRIRELEALLNKSEAQCAVCLKSGGGREPVCPGCLQHAGDLVKTAADNKGVASDYETDVWHGWIISAAGQLTRLAQTAPPNAEADAKGMQVLHDLIRICRQGPRPSEATHPDCGCTDGTDADEPPDRGFICPHDPRGFDPRTAEAHPHWGACDCLDSIHHELRTENTALRAEVELLRRERVKTSGEGEVSRSLAAPETAFVSTTPAGGPGEAGPTTPCGACDGTGWGPLTSGGVGEQAYFQRSPCAVCRPRSEPNAGAADLHVHGEMPPEGIALIKEAYATVTGRGGPNTRPCGTCVPCRQAAPHDCWCPVAAPTPGVDDLHYACVNCATPLKTSGMCETCSRAYGIGRAEERLARQQDADSSGQADPRDAVVAAAKVLRRANEEKGWGAPRPDIAWRDLLRALDALPPELAMTTEKGGNDAG